MINLRIQQEQGGFFTRVTLFHKDDKTGQLSAPVWDEASKTIQFTRLTDEEARDMYFSMDTHPFEILRVSERTEGGDGGREMIQGLLDDLWQQGFRPSNAVDRTDTLKAQDKHIADLNETRVALTGIVEQAIDRIPRS